MYYLLIITLLPFVNSLKNTTTTTTQNMNQYSNIVIAITVIGTIIFTGLVLLCFYFCKCKNERKTNLLLLNFDEL